MTKEDTLIISIPLYADKYLKLKSICEREGIFMTTLVRDLVINEIEKRENCSGEGIANG